MLCEAYIMQSRTIVDKDLMHEIPAISEVSVKWVQVFLMFSLYLDGDKNEHGIRSSAHVQVIGQRIQEDTLERSLEAENTYDCLHPCGVECLIICTPFYHIDYGWGRVSFQNQVTIGEKVVYIVSM